MYVVCHLCVDQLTLLHQKRNGNYDYSYFEWILLGGKVFLIDLVILVVIVGNIKERGIPRKITTLAGICLYPSVSQRHLVWTIKRKGKIRTIKPINYKLANAKNRQHQSRWTDSTLAFNSSPDAFTAAFSPSSIASGTELRIPFLPITAGELRQHPYSS
jgi:hypothetical protein